MPTCPVFAGPVTNNAGIIGTSLLIESSVSKLCACVRAYIYVVDPHPVKINQLGDTECYMCNYSRTA